MCLNYCCKDNWFILLLVLKKKQNKDLLFLQLDFFFNKESGVYWIEMILNAKNERCRNCKFGTVKNKGI